MDLKQIEIFLKVAETKSFTKAAEALFMSQQHVSKRVAELEQELGLKLFERTTKRVRITEIGQLAYYKLSRNLLAIENSIAELKTYSRGEMPLLRIGIYSGVRKAVFASVMRKIYTQIPPERIDITISEHVGGFQVLDAGKQDIFFTFIDEAEKWEDYGQFPVERRPYQLIVGKQHPWCRKKIIEASDMQREIFQRLEILPGTVGMNIFLRMPYRICEESENMKTVLTKVEMGRGFTILPVEDEIMESYEVQGINMNFEKQTVLLVGLYQKNNENPVLRKILTGWRFDR